MKIPLEERIKLTFGENEGEEIVYVSKSQSDISSGKVYSFYDLCSLNGKEVNVQNDGQTSYNIIINIEPELLESILKISIEFQFDPTLTLAVMAHESGFDKDAISEAGAIGLMQTMPQWFYDNAEPYKEFIESLGGDYNDPYDPITNIVSWSNGLKTWFRTYGETEEALRALRQGYKGSKWIKGAILNGQEFLDIKQQLDSHIFN